MNKIITKSEKETFAFAEELGKNIKAGVIFALFGDLGAGKTVFTKGLAKGLGCKKTITSPTFVIMKVYPVIGNRNIKKLCHIDAYRLTTAEDLEAIGALEYFERDDVVVVIEWPERIKKILPKAVKQIKLKHKKEDIREIEIKNKAYKNL